MFKQYMMVVANSGMGLGALAMIVGLFGTAVAGFAVKALFMMMFIYAFWFVIAMVIVKFVLALFGTTDGIDEDDEERYRHMGD